MRATWSGVRAGVGAGRGGERGGRQRTATAHPTFPLPTTTQQEWLTPQPSRRPDTQPEFERLDPGA